MVTRRVMLHIGVGLSLICAAGCQRAQEPSAPLAGEARRRANRTEAADRIIAQREAAARTDDCRVWPGVLANRTQRDVLFFAEATGISDTTPVEFFLVGEQSGHDYEALAIALARPADIREALLFIGMPEGTSVDPKRFRFWPRGERATITIGGIRAETLIMDEERDAPLAPTGLVFTGSKLVPASTNTTALVPCATIREPFAIAANYNESASLFDVPWQASQGAVYAKQSANPAHLFDEGALLPVRIRPTSVGQAPHMRDLTLQMAPGPDGIHVLEEGRTADTDGSLAGALAYFTSLRDDGFDCHVEVRLSDMLTLTEARTLASVLKSVDVDTGIRIGPPAPGRLYYGAYAPPPAYASREGRLQQPWELRLRRDDENDAIRGTLTQLDEEWNEERKTHEVGSTDLPVANAAELAQTLGRRGPGLPVIIVFAAASDALCVGELISFIQPVLNTHPMIFVFEEQP